MTRADRGAAGTSVAVVTLGCGRNEVDSDQIGGALLAAGYALVDDPADAACVVVNTCTFVEAARRDSIDAVLDAATAADGAPVLVVGCMAERYGDELADALPEVAGVLGFADYARLPAMVGGVLRGDDIATLRAAPVPEALAAPRRGLPVLGISRGGAPPIVERDRPPTAAFPIRTQPRGVWAYLKLAGGCDRTCTFCTIPSYRGRFASRPLDELLAETRWLVDEGVREVVGVSENTTSWGKDLGGRHLQVDLVEGLSRIEGLVRARLLYLQPAELQPALLDAMAASPVVAAYYDLSLQHAAPDVVRRMGRSGGAERFLELVRGIRARDPRAVFRSSFIVGFPGETERDVEILAEFLAEARLDWTGFFEFSPEDGTPAATMPDQIPRDEARARRDALLDVAEAVAADLAQSWVGCEVDVLVESREGDEVVGRSEREAPETDGEVRLTSTVVPAVGDVVRARVLAADGVDLVAESLLTVAGRP